MKAGSAKRLAYLLVAPFPGATAQVGATACPEEDLDASGPAAAAPGSRDGDDAFLGAGSGVTSIYIRVLQSTGNSLHSGTHVDTLVTCGK